MMYCKLITYHKGTFQNVSKIFKIMKEIKYIPKSCYFFFYTSYLIFQIEI